MLEPQAWAPEPDLQTLSELRRAPVALQLRMLMPSHYVLARTPTAAPYPQLLDAIKSIEQATHLRPLGQSHVTL